ncbi:MAG: ribosome silencing factor [Dehalococcoidia bacterium]|nr:MAG: ribosome silencing factor [Dehalococcoidia bacterium]
MVGETKLEAIDLARRVADIALEKQAENIIITDIRGLSSITDYQVTLSADNQRLARAIFDDVIDKLKKEGVRPLFSEGIGQDSEWLIVDYGAVMLHIFTPQKRSFFDFDHLWPEAKTVLALQ